MQRIKKNQQKLNFGQEKSEGGSSTDGHFADCFISASQQTVTMSSGERIPALIEELNLFNSRQKHRLFSIVYLTDE